MFFLLQFLFLRVQCSPYMPAELILKQYQQLYTTIDPAQPSTQKVNSVAKGTTILFYASFILSSSMLQMCSKTHLFLLQSLEVVSAART